MRQVPYAVFTWNNPICRWPGIKQDIKTAVQVIREAEDKRIFAEAMAEMDKWLDKKLRKRDYQAWKEKHQPDRISHESL